MSSHDDSGGAQLGRKVTPRRAEKPSVTAGFGSPADDATVKRIDLNDALISHPEATFVMRASGDAMWADGIDNGDILVVDRAIKPAHNHIVVAVVEDDFVCRRLYKQKDVAKLTASASDVKDIEFGDGAALEVWGVVTHAVKSFVK